MRPPASSPWRRHRRSTDVMIPGYTPQGKLYGAEISAESDGGTIMPLIADFNARAADGQTYRVIDAVPVPDGISPTPLDQGQQASRGVSLTDWSPARASADNTPSRCRSRSSRHNGRGDPLADEPVPPEHAADGLPRPFPDAGSVRTASGSPDGKGRRHNSFQRRKIRQAAVGQRRRGRRSGGPHNGGFLAEGAHSGKIPIIKLAPRACWVLCMGQDERCRLGAPGRCS